jgi:hypothetical protein
MTEEIVIPIGCKMVRRIEIAIINLILIGTCIASGGLIGFIGRMIIEENSFFSWVFGGIVIPFIFMMTCWMAFMVCDVKIKCKVIEP